MTRPSIIDLIDTHMETIQEENDRDVTRFHPSLIGYCSRKIAYTMLRYPAPLIDARTMRIFECGHSMHERFERWFGEIGIQIATELILNEDSPDEAIASRCVPLNISGRTDSLVVIDDELYLVELKSANGNMFKYYLNEPKEHHVQQLQLYMYLTGVHKGFILYEDKNTQELKEFYIQYDHKLVEQLLEKIRMINYHVENRMLPNKEGKPSEWQCKYCEFRGICHYPQRPENQALLEEYKNRSQELTQKYNDMLQP